MMDASGKLEFQSTLPVRGATATPSPFRFWDSISIHAPREGSDGYKIFQFLLPVLFQSTLPVRGATCGSTRPKHPACRFQSTLPVRGATIISNPPYSVKGISIHAPREGSDLSLAGDKNLDVIISIHAPREGSDDGHPLQAGGPGISIHAPREGSDHPPHG